MNAWIFAIVVLVGILGFEVAVFRYLVTEGSAATGEVTNGAGSGDTASVATDTDDDASSARECRKCGTVNADSRTVHYCRSCLARIH